MTLLRTALPGLFVLLLWLTQPGSFAHAHPMVSTDINRHVTLAVDRQGISVRYVYEMLEIAALAAARRADRDGNGATSDAERDAHVARWRDQLMAAVSVSAAGKPLPLEARQVRWELGPAPFGLHTWKITAEFHAPAVAADRVKLDYRDAYNPEEAGWKEIVLQVAPGMQVRARSGDLTDRSRALTDFGVMNRLPNPEQRSARIDLLVPTQAAPAIDRLEAPQHLPPSTTLGMVTQARAETNPADAQAPAPGWRQFAWPFFRLGVHHIAIGWDHLAFLLGLLLLRLNLSRLAWVITAFTIAHSMTLACAAMGWIRPPGAMVEVLIAVSIAYIGAVSLLRPTVQHGPALAFGFGLVHGFGFAGALSETLGEVDHTGWLWALAGFNLGIEVFQLALVSLAFPLLRYLDRYSWAKGLRNALSCVVVGLGIYWSAQRLIQI